MTDDQMLTHDTTTVNLLANSRRVILVATEIHKNGGVTLSEAIQIVQTAAILQEKGDHNG